MELADISLNIGVNLWHYEAKDGRNILKAAEFMAQYADPKMKLPRNKFTQRTGINWKSNCAERRIFEKKL